MLRNSSMFITIVSLRQELHIDNYAMHCYYVYSNNTKEMKREGMKMKRSVLLILVVLLVTVLLSGCTEKGELTILYGESAPIELSKEYVALTWETGDANIAVVEGGTITGVGPGQTTITASSDSKAVAEYTVLVGIIEIKELFLQASELTLEIDAETTLGYSLFPTDASDYGLEYTSINPDIATVDGNGKITGVAAGKTNIVVSTKSGITASCEVTVKEPSAIDQLNHEETRIFTYLIEKGLQTFYNASAVRFRNIYYMANTNPSANLVIACFQGTNKLGGTIYRYYFLGTKDDMGDGYMLPCKEDFYPDAEDYQEMPADTISYAKLNAALDEYWGVTKVTD